MRSNLKINLPIFTLCFIFSLTSSASSNDSVKESSNVVTQWNNFVTDIYRLHLNQTEKKEIKKLTRSGSYHRLPDFFQEIKYYDSNNNLLSRIEWETKNPEKIHSIEVFIRDKDNRIVREYSASFLPKHRNAPYQTLINFHNYGKSLHSYRQFDASDNLLYEVCTQTKSKTKIYEHDDYEIPDNLKTGVGRELTYRDCFQKLPRTAGLFINPH